MGSTESSEGRRVSFGVDEEERVRVLQGVRLSENVVNRMKEPSSPPPAPAPSTFGLQDGNLRAPHKESTLPRSGSTGGQQPSGTKEGVKRYEQEHGAVQDKLFQVAKREREAATKHSKASLPTGEGSIRHEEQKSVRLNAEMYKLSSQQFHEAASKMESTINFLQGQWPLPFYLEPGPTCQGEDALGEKPDSFLLVTIMPVTCQVAHHHEGRDSCPTSPFVNLALLS
ncbi:MICOS complex subunit MIC25 isoform X6 [Symphalangus syndactylus]|uniref:MICOS complex subunit MIC25 isoform X6 n=1 Tax=Symphalangus syndactylus TaxID=9590 RepID=UPI0030060451